MSKELVESFIQSPLEFDVQIYVRRERFIRSQIRSCKISGSFGHEWSSSFALDDRSHYSDCIRLLMPDRPCSHSINAPLVAGILDARTSIISRSRVTDPFHFPSSYHPGRIFIILDASVASRTHHQVLPASIVRSFTLSIELMIILCLSCADLSRYLLPRNRIVIPHACAM